MKTERQKLLDYMDKNNTITTTELWDEITNMLESHLFEPMDHFTYMQMQNQINEYFLYLERSNIKVFSDTFNSFVVGAILRFSGSGTLHIRVEWVKPDGSLIK
jgi:hypothetical protein